MGDIADLARACSGEGHERALREAPRDLVQRSSIQRHEEHGDLRVARALSAAQVRCGPFMTHAAQQLDNSRAISRVDLEERRRQQGIHQHHEGQIPRSSKQIVARDGRRIGDGIARIHGLAGCQASELLDFGHETFGLAFNLEEDTVSAIILGEYAHIKEGDEVRTTGRIVETPAGEGLIGRVVDPLGRPLDGKGPVKASKNMRMDVVAPGVIERQNVDTPVGHGHQVDRRDVPIGRGQRELIIGARQTGRRDRGRHDHQSEGKDLICIYVAIGRRSPRSRSLSTLEEHGAMEHTIVVIAGASDSATLQYWLPFGGARWASTSATRPGRASSCTTTSPSTLAYRQVSLLVRRPPGREAYPGDVSTCTAVCSTRRAHEPEERRWIAHGAADHRDAVERHLRLHPTNVISITDGQLFM